MPQKLELDNDDESEYHDAHCLSGVVAVHLNIKLLEANECFGNTAFILLASEVFDEWQS